VAETAPGNGVCTLRAAIQEANVLVDPDTINLPAGTYILTIAGADEDASATGDLDITSNLTITGAGQATTIVGGGGLDRVFHILAGSTAAISGVAVQNGDTGDNGGGICNEDGTLTLTNSTVSGNSAASWGGGIYSEDGALTLTNSTVSGNSADWGGGGIYNYGALALTDSTVSGNSADRGGGIYNEDGTLTLTNSTISGNSADRGGGIGNWDSLTLTNSTVSGNSAASWGGGIYNKDGTLTLTNSTVSGNSAASWGGGIYNEDGTLTLTNSTVSDNSAASWGGGIYNRKVGVTVELINAIIADNPSGSDCYGEGDFASLGHNLDGDGTCNLTEPTDLPSTNPLLGPLADNGGPSFTHALLADSPAIDAGNNTGAPATDQRGVARPIDGDGDGTATCDIGAYEYVRPGDANLDGLIDGRDVIRCKKIILGFEPETCGADANVDGVVDGRDVIRIKKTILGIE
jgi:hypothetical protein